MAINIVWNRQSGPGGGTRRLHHDEERVDKINSFFDIRLKFNLLFFGGEIGSTHVVKIVFSLGMISTVIGSM